MKKLLDRFDIEHLKSHSKDIFDGIIAKKDCKAIFHAVLRCEIVVASAVLFPKRAKQCIFPKESPSIHLDLPIIRQGRYLSMQGSARTKLHLLHSIVIQNVVFRFLYCFNLDVRYY